MADIFLADMVCGRYRRPRLWLGLDEVGVNIRVRIRDWVRFRVSLQLGLGLMIAFMRCGTKTEETHAHLNEHAVKRVIIESWWVRVNESKCVRHPLNAGDLVGLEEYCNI